MPIVNPAFITLQDFSREKSSVSFNLEGVQDNGGVLDIADSILKIALLLAAIDPIVMGVVTGSGLTYADAQFTSPPSDPNAQREKKWLVSYRDISPTIGSPAQENPNFGRVYNLEIPTAQLSTALVNRRDEWTYDEFTQLPAVWHTFKEALEFNVVSPSGGAIRVEKVTFVGRNT